MNKSLVALCGAFLAFAGPVAAEERLTLGIGHMFSNDYFGDGDDRWRSGSYVISVIRGPYWQGAYPQQFGSLLEYRLRTEFIAPSTLSNPPAWDRRYAGVLSFGVHTYFSLGQAEATAGLDLVGVGPGTGVGRWHDWLHQQISAPSVNVLDDQIGDRIAPTVSGEIAQTYAFGDSVALRPFVEARAGDETLVRVGADLNLGAIETGALLSRDVVTGHRYVSASGKSDPGASFVLGGDMAYVMDSMYLPGTGPAELEDTRTRLRAGMQLRSGRMGLFYGLTWLSEEFKSQPEGQLLGSVRFRVNF